MAGLGLLDVLPQSESVEINGKKVPVWGLSGHAIGHLLVRFPDLTKLFDPSVDKDIKVNALKTTAPAAIAPICAAACGNLGDEEAEKIADRIGADVQLKILSITRRLTFKEGAGPFGEQLLLLMGETAPGDPGRESSMRSPRPRRPSEPPPVQASGT